MVFAYFLNIFMHNKFWQNKKIQFLKTKKFGHHPHMGYVCANFNITTI